MKHVSNHKRVKQMVLSYVDGLGPIELGELVSFLGKLGLSEREVRDALVCLRLEGRVEGESVVKLVGFEAQLKRAKA